MNETDLTLELLGKGNSLPPFSARECTQTLTLLPQGTLRRTINGILVHVGNKGHRKFQSTISCKDKASPALDGIWKGDLVKVGCIQSLTQTVPQGIERIQLERESVFLSLYDAKGKLWPVEKEEERWISFSSEFLGGFIVYRPLLTMVVKHYHLEIDEWNLSVEWSLELEEV